MEKFINTLLNYLTQSSTYTGLVAILTAFGLVIKPELSDAIVTCALGVFGLIQVVINERKEDKK